MDSVVQASAQSRVRRPSVTVPAPPVTVADLVASGDDARVELIDGLCVVRPWPTPLRARVTSRLARLLTDATTSGAQVLTAGVGMQVSSRCLLVPDVVVTSSPAPADSRPLQETPFLVVEVADASTRRYDRTIKLDLYREWGVPACWLVDPDTMTLTAFELVAGAYVPTSVTGPDATFRTVRPFPVTVRTAELIDPPDAD
ncbi:Uma2 family endonuclease [Frankia sp. R82]|uniref:Uma2 family endonuclease n=1 Tax=Frankia sp. R82 TaxID=2950553 RepID=UPI002044CE1C|nr:Uma2 family endonuclease [Frankia sp. R82]MCM3886392.1 Uma2 family endonuclease [Frankia sp. R82]